LDPYEKYGCEKQKIEKQKILVEIEKKGYTAQRW
jgi:hypothetical protein